MKRNRKLEKRIVSGLIALLIILTPLCTPITVRADENSAPVSALTGVVENVTENETLEDVAENSVTSGEVLSSEGTEVSEEVSSEEKTASEEEKSETVKEDTSEENVSEQEGTLVDEGDSLHAVMLEKTENAELSVFSTLEGSDVEINPIQVQAEEEGLEVLEGYEISGKADDVSSDDTDDSKEDSEDSEEAVTANEIISSEDSEIAEGNAEETEDTEDTEEKLFVKAEVSEEADLSPRETVALYSVEDNKAKDVIIEDISLESEPCEIDEDVTGIALVKDTGYRHLNFEYYPENGNYDNAVILDGMMPKESRVDILDVKEDSISDDALVAYDITIIDGSKEYQPNEERPITVTVKDADITEDFSYIIRHIKDDGEIEEITEYELKDGEIIFEAKGFSVYEIVVDDAVVPYNDSNTGWKRVTSIDDLLDYASNGLLICHVNRYFATDSLFTITENKRWGIKKTAQITNNNNANIFCENALLGGATRYYLEDMESGENSLKCKMYCIDADGNKQYVQQKVVTGGSLVFVSSQDEATVFSIESHSSTTENDFIIAKDDGTSGDTRFCWNQQSGNNGKAFATYGNTADANAQLYLWYYIPIVKDPYELDGKTYGLMNYVGGTSGNALIASETDNHLQLLDLVVRTNGGTGEKDVYISEDKNITAWTFHSVTEDFYTLSAVVNGETKYIKVNDDGSLSFVAEGSASQIKVTPGSGSSSGKIRMTFHDKSLVFENDRFSFKSGGGTNNQWINFLDTTTINSDDYVTYTADKISISDANNGDRVIVYTRIWNDIAKEYEFYAVDHDGSLVRCYERGGNIMWIGDQINTLLWDFTEYYYAGTNIPNNYYELQNTYSKQYLAPQITGNQVMANKKIGINLPNRMEQEYYSDIIAWDDDYYSYAGIKAEPENDRIVSCPVSETDTFYFAVVEKNNPELIKVATIDNTKYGITMKMVDYPKKVGSEHRQDDVFGDNGNTRGLLSTKLEDDGYPMAKLTNKSLKELYTGANQATEVNHLFIENTYNESGYFEFDSCQNFATLYQEDGNLGSNFIVYEQLGTWDGDVHDRTTLKHGQFFPYNKIEEGKYSTQSNLYSALAKYGEPGVGILPESDPRKYEKLYSIGLESDVNFHNGMEMEASFVQTPSGKDDWGHDIIFEFTGDDDFWLYVDKELVIDLGGIHSALAGNINFSTGKVCVDGVETTLLDVFRNNYKGRKPDATDAEVNAYLDQFFAFDADKGEYEKIFKDYSTHTMKIFYMERGAGASNLHMRFNLSYVTPGSVTLEKKVSGSDDLDFNLVEYPFQIYYVDPADGTEKLLSNTDALVSVKYQNSTKSVKYQENYVPSNTTAEPYHNVYFLNLDKKVEISFPINTVHYRIVEVGVNEEVYSNVTVNGVDAEKSPLISGSSTRHDFDSRDGTVSERPNVVFDNEVNPEGLRTLTIQKKVYDTDCTTEILDDPSVFSFRLYLAKNKNETLTLANRYKYRVLNRNRELCTWDAANQKFVSTGISNSAYSTLSDSMKQAVTFETSMNGTISKIPSGYFVEVPNLPVDATFKLEERDDEVPLGYQLIDYKRAVGSYKPAEDGDPNSGTVRANESPEMYVNNKRGFELAADKIWSDEEYMDSYAPIYTAVFKRTLEHDDQTGEDKWVPDGNSQVPGTIRKIAYPDTRVRVFLDNIETGETIDNYGIYEIKIDNPVETDGVITGENITLLANGDLTTVNARAKKSGVETPYSYSVGYTDGVSKSTSGDGTLNVRTDTITNTREGGVVIRLFDMNTRKPLANGIFTLKKGNTVLGNYTSDANGRVTILYDFARNEDYILTETESPAGYLGVPNEVHFSVAADDTVTVTGNDEKWVVGRKSESSGDNLIAYIDVYNEPYTLQVLKVEKTTKIPVEGAHFALYKGVDSLSGKVKDYNPMPGFEDIVSDENGILPGINQTLSAGVYYLTETAAPAGYTGYDKDIVFAIDNKGFVTIDEENEELLEESSPDGKTFQYIISVPNKLEGYTLTVTKTVTGSMGNKAKDFTFTFTAQPVTGSTIDADTEYIWSKNGVAQSTKLKTGETFLLAHGDEVKIVLPDKAEVTITETNEGYTTVTRLDNEQAAQDGPSRVIDMDANHTLYVTNTLEGVIPTGVSVPIGMLVIAGLIAIGGIVGSVLRQRKMKEEC